MLSPGTVRVRRPTSSTVSPETWFMQCTRLHVLLCSWFAHFIGLITRWQAGGRQVRRFMFNVIGPTSGSARLWTTVGVLAASALVSFAITIPSGPMAIGNLGNTSLYIRQCQYEGFATGGWTGASKDFNWTIVPGASRSHTVIALSCKERHRVLTLGDRVARSPQRSKWRGVLPSFELQHQVYHYRTFTACSSSLQSFSCPRFPHA